MIKVQNNTATRAPLPTFLVGLKQESLYDLSWTDPALGVQDCAWWPEEDQSPALGQFEVYGAETLTIDEARKVVVVTRSVESMPQEEIDAIREQQLNEIRSQRADAYRNEADPLFFKWQAGEATQEEWVQARQDVRNRYPYPEDTLE
jgi:hypothetical protein